LLKCNIISFCGKKETIYPYNHYILYNIYVLLVMKVTAKKEEPPLLLLVVTVSLIAAAAAGGTFFTVTPSAFADDLTAEDILSLQDLGQRKVTICHIPNDNPANAHEITVGESAVSAYIIHGDTIGPCQPTSRVRI
jgi:hypothetical protein